ncbi:hypothetical protein J2W27_004425 [Variovorax boronicumulans]|uniref:hypothetical protein n=1 Tax=Variovorax boronicumulans TaxID=436515 RepID=UPI002785F179|nr:hypothetical protein [Variovorax boronicumulans]MDP9912299.1 hypothetical protein [Variovorax boronicumulans]
MSYAPRKAQGWRGKLTVSAPLCPFFSVDVVAPCNSKPILFAWFFRIEQGAWGYMDMAAISSLQWEVFSYNFVLPIPLDGSMHRRLEVIGVFRALPAGGIDRWVMDTNGKPRADKDLAAEVLVEFRRDCGTSGQTTPLEVEMSQVLASTRATAAIVAAFLAGHPRVETSSVVPPQRSGRIRTQWAWGEDGALPAR